MEEEKEFKSHFHPPNNLWASLVNISPTHLGAVYLHSRSPRIFMGPPYNTDLGADLLIPMAPFWNHHAHLFSEIICNDSTLKEAQTNPFPLEYSKLADPEDIEIF